MDPPAIAPECDDRTRSVASVTASPDVRPFHGTGPGVPELLAAPDLSALAAALLALDDPGRRAVRGLLPGARRAVTTWAGAEDFVFPLLWEQRTQALDLCAAALLPPGEAARVFTYARWGWLPDADFAALVEVLVARGGPWRTRFVETASRRRVPARLSGSRAVYMLVLRTLSDRFGLEPPVHSDEYVRGWLSHQAVVGDLRTAWARDPHIAKVLPRALGHDGVHAFPGLPSAVEHLVDEGVLDRTVLVRACLDHLLAPRRPATQRVQVQVLQRLDVCAPDLAAFPAALTLVATCHTAVVDVVLSLALDLAAGAEDLRALATTLAGRREKKHRTALRRALVGSALLERLGREAVLGAALALREGAGDASELQSAEQVVRALGGAASVVATPARPSGLWQQEPVVAAEPALDRRPLPAAGSPGAADAVLLATMDHRHRSLRNRRDHVPAVDDALALLVGWAAAVGVDEVRASLAAGRVAEGNRTPAAEALEVWRLGFLDRGWFDHWVRAVRSHTVYDGEVHPVAARLGAAAVDARLAVAPPVWDADTVARWRRRERIGMTTRAYPGDPVAGEPLFLDATWGGLAYVHACETLLRLGRMTGLLSTPSRPDGSIAFEDLRDRLRAEADAGPVDLFRALLRLEPVGPDRLGELDGLALPLDREVCGPDAPAVLPDAVEVVRDWVRAKGLRARVRLHTDSARASRYWVLAHVEVPAAARALPTIPPHLLQPDGNRRNTDDNAVADLLPWHPEVVAAQTSSSWTRDERDDPGLLAWVCTVPGPLGPAVLDHLLGLQESTDELVRDAGSRHLLRLLAQGRLDTALLVQVAADRLTAGELSLVRLARAWEQLLGDGSLRRLWHAALGIGAAAVSQTPRPPGAADWLRMLAGFVSEVPEPALPAALAAFAAGRGTTSAHLEARALAAACAGGAR